MSLRIPAHELASWRRWPIGTPRSASGGVLPPVVPLLAERAQRWDAATGHWVDETPEPLFGPLCGSAQCADRCAIGPGRFGCPALSPPHPMTKPNMTMHKITIDRWCFERAMSEQPAPAG